MTVATGVGSMPGGEVGAEADNARAYAEAVRIVLGELPDLPHVPELPGRGAGASMTGRAVALLAGLGADLQPAGWRLTDAAGVDQRRARSLLGQDLDQGEEQAQGHSGVFKVQVAGPWTLAATVERPRGDKVLADHGARRDLAQALADGVADHVADVRRRLVGVDRLVLQVDEPGLPEVLGGRVPTASGFGRHRTVDLPEASTALQWVLTAAAEAGAEPWVHSCAAGVPWSSVRDAGAKGLSVDAGRLDAAGLDAAAQALEAGETVALGLVAATDPAAPPAPDQVAEQAQRWLDMLGLDPAEVGDRLVVTPSCGLAGATSAWATRALTLCRKAAENLS